MFKIPLHALIVMVGPSGAGKSSFIEESFSSHEVVSSDDIRQELTGDFRHQHLNSLVFEEFHRRIKTKLEIGERVVADATHLRKKDRLKTAMIGVDLHIPVFYIVIDRPLEDKLATGGWRLEAKGLIEKHHETFKGQERDITRGDGIATVIDTRTSIDEGAETIEVVEKFDFYNIDKDIRNRGFDGVTVIGDVHGMTDDFEKHIKDAKEANHLIVQLGDIVDYGPDAVGCVELMYRLVVNGEAMFIIGNHERKLEKYLQQFKEGKVRIQVQGGIVATVEQLNRLGDTKREMFELKFRALMNYARHHIRIDNNVFVHASVTRNMWTSKSNRLVGFDENRAVFGEVDQNSPRNEDGYPNRLYNWVDELPQGHTAYVGHAYLDLVNPVTKNGKLGGKAVFVDTGSGKEGSLSSVKITL